jgi:hypothetical protein
MDERIIRENGIPGAVVSDEAAQCAAMWTAAERAHPVLNEAVSLFRGERHLIRASGQMRSQRGLSEVHMTSSCRRYFGSNASTLSPHQLRRTASSEVASRVVSAQMIVSWSSSITSQSGSALVPAPGSRALY